MIDCEFIFTPTQVFRWEIEARDGTKSVIGEYHPGMTYNCTFQPRHDKLREKCREWYTRGWIKVLPLGRKRFVTATHR